MKWVGPFNWFHFLNEIKLTGAAFIKNFQFLYCGWASLHFFCRWWSLRKWVSYRGLTHFGLMGMVSLIPTNHRKPLQSTTRRIRSGSGGDHAVFERASLLPQKRESFMMARSSCAILTFKEMNPFHSFPQSSWGWMMKWINFFSLPLQVFPFLIDEMASWAGPSIN